MAQKRMFSLKIVDTDEFLDMPLSTQCLYFHLGMRADDEGFIGNAQRIMRMIGAGPDDLKILIAKRFLIQFESGVHVIKHWKINNYLQNDRTQETTYLEEKAQLFVKKNKAYTECIHNVSIDKISTDKNRLDEISIDEGNGTPAASEVPIDYDKVIQYWNQTSGLDHVISITPERIKLINYADMQFGRAAIATMIEKVGSSKFLKGQTKGNWKAKFNWCFEAENFVQILEGNYDDTANPEQNSKLTFMDVE